MTAIKPMLAHSKTPDLSTLTYPQLVQPKFDGIRAMVVDGVLLSRTAKPIRNAEIQAALGRPEFNGLDGELLVGPPTAQDAMQRTSEVVMKEDRPGRPWVFYVFDKYDAEGATDVRWEAARLQLLNLSGLSPAPVTRCVMVPNIVAYSPEDVQAAESTLVAEGYEGAILRDPRAPYKHGRSGKAGPLLKVKRFSDSEAVCIGVVEQMTNLNEAKRDAFGRTERSSSKAGKVPAGVLGALVCRTPEGVEFEIGTGFTAAQRQYIWIEHLRAGEHPNNEPVVGRLVKYKHFEVGVKTAPRFPVFLGFRDRDDV